MYDQIKAELQIHHTFQDQKKPTWITNTAKRSYEQFTWTINLKLAQKVKREESRRQAEEENLEWTWKTWGGAALKRKRKKEDEKGH